MKSEKIVLGLLAGFALGALSGILLAPDKGRITRKKIFSKANHYSNNLKVEFEELVNHILVKYGCTREEAEYLVSRGESEFTSDKKEASL